MVGMTGRKVIRNENVKIQAGTKTELLYLLFFFFISSCGSRRAELIHSKTVLRTRRKGFIIKLGSNLPVLRDTMHDSTRWCNNKQTRQHIS